LSLSINGTSYSGLHFTGILGSGMSAIAQYCAWLGLRVSGSDRLLGTPDVAAIADRLSAIGCLLYKQDGSGIDGRVGAPGVALVVSTAIEGDNPDVAAARAAGIPLFHRSDVLAALVSSKRAIAVAGTSGKSTVTAMIWEFLFSCGKDPSLVSGANLIGLEEKGYIGNAYRGTSDILVIEADESDGTLVKYQPDTAVFLNVSKDHKPVAETMELFRTLARQSSLVIANADDRQLDVLKPDMTFGTTAATVSPDAVMTLTPNVSFLRAGQRFDLPLPGGHNLSNCLAALAVCESAGCAAPDLARAVSAYKGVLRRFSVTRLENGMLVIDDYAHNPEKIRAAMLAAQGFSSRVIAVFQPHGFGPTRFLKDDLVFMFSETLRPCDVLLLLPIYYAGGTAQKDISSDDIVSLVNSRGRTAFVAADRTDLVSRILATASPGDAVLVMGARDPTLGTLVKEIIRSLRPMAFT
jgi:UDP-N-acetylmuramate--alanine ligase